MKLVTHIFHYFFSSFRPNSSATVRYAFPLVFAFAALLAATSIVSENKSFVHLETSVKSVKAGEQFQIGVYVNANVPVNAVDLSLAFPKQQINIIGIDTGQSVITLWTKEPYVENNAVIMRGGTFRKGFLGDHLIATINARATETGLAQFSVDSIMLLAGDGSGSRVAIANTGGEKTSLFVVKENGTPIASDSVGLKGTASVAIITDLDKDGKVTLSDISQFMSAWSSKSATYDFDGDGVMTFKDFGIILADSFIHQFISR